MHTSGSKGKAMRNYLSDKGYRYMNRLGWNEMFERYPRCGAAEGQPVHNHDVKCFDPESKSVEEKSS